MSTTELYVVARDGDVLYASSFQNAHGGAMAVWRLLVERYFTGTDERRTLDFLIFMENGLKPLFDLARSGGLEPWEFVTLMTTCDNVIIPIAHVASTAAAFEKFVEHYGPLQLQKGRAFSIEDQAVELRRIVEEAPSEGWRGVCWNQTSVNGDALWAGFSVQEEDEDLCEDEDGWRPYNVNRDEGHWYWPSGQTPE